MRLLADLHTHTVASGHAFSTVTELATAAAERGLELIAVTDHGPGLPGGPHPLYFHNLKSIPARIAGVRILRGIEANVASARGRLDLDDETLAQLDFVAIGFHPGFDFNDRDPDKVTEALLGAMENPLVDMVTHAGSRAVDPVAVAEAAARLGVMIELNNLTFRAGSSRSGTGERERAVVAAAMAAGAPIAIDSDAHIHFDVGLRADAIAVARELGLTEERVVNRDAASVFAHLRARRPRPGLDVAEEGGA